MMNPEQSKFRIGELATHSGLPISTVRHYINEGLLGDPCQRSRNMAYYDHTALPLIAMIKSLQDDLFLPLKVIKRLLGDYDDLNAEEYDLLLTVRGRLAERHSELLPELAEIPHSVVRELNLNAEELAALEDNGVVSPRGDGDDKRYNEVDFRILNALSAVRACGFGEELGTTDDLGFYLASLRRLAKIETRLFAKRVGRDRSIEDIIELIRKGLPAINEVISTLHHKLLMEELTRLEKDETDKPDT
jgi:DNA-binding transcriptional MerR regulator